MNCSHYFSPIHLRLLLEGQLQSEGQCNQKVSYFNIGFGRTITKQQTIAATYLANDTDSVLEVFLAK